MGQAATVHMKLDPTQTGKDAEKLERGLHKRVIGQKEAIDQIINVFQTYLAGLNSPGRPIANFLFFGADRYRQNQDRRSHSGNLAWRSARCRQD